MSSRRRTAILVTSSPGQVSAAELERLAAEGELPRRDYVELARRLDAEVFDGEYIGKQGRLGRLLARPRLLPLGQIAEGARRRGQFDVIVAWADRLGLPLALLFKLLRARTPLVLVAMLVSDREKAVFLKQLKVHSHLAALVFHDRIQAEFAANRLGVPKSNLHIAKQGIDERFWRPQPGTTESLICAVGWEARDYRTLLRAVEGLPLELQIAIGSVGSVRAEQAAARLQRDGLPSNVAFVWPTTKGLRDLYSRSRFVVLPLHDVPYEPGSTTLLEAMAMEKAVILSRTRGGTDILRDGEQGLYVPPANPAALREAIEFLDSNPDVARRMGRAGRTLVEERYTLDGYVERLSRIITEVAGPARRR